MRKNKLLFLFALGLPCLSFTSNEEEISSFIITSFEIDIDAENKMIYFTSKYDCPAPSAGLTVDLYWHVKRDDVQKQFGHAMLNNFKKGTDFTVTVKPKLDLTTLGENNEFILYIYPNDIKGFITKTLRYNVKGVSEVQFTESDNNIGVSSGYIVESQSSKDESKNYIKEDRLTFSNYEDLVVEDYYLNFDIRRFKYTYSGNEGMLDGNFYFLIYDKYNLFLDLPIYKSSQYRYIELTPSVFNGDSVFSFKENHYYDPITHNMSSNYKEGYKETNKLYFPAGKLDQLKSMHCMLSFDIKGYTNFNMSSQFDIYFLKNYFGDCLDSEYCIGMNNDDGINVREKVIDINL